MRLRRFGMALSVGAMLSVALAGPASAIELIELSGNHGDFGTKLATADSPDAPGAKCIYGSPDAGGFAHLAGMKVFAFNAAAYDGSAGVDQQPVRFKVTLQRSANGGATWKNVGSKSQTKNATDAQSAKLSALRVSTSGKAGQLYRAIVTLDWLRNGAVDGRAKMRMLYYGVKWTVGDPAFVYENACDGVAD